MSLRYFQDARNCFPTTRRTFGIAVHRRGCSLGTTTHTFALRMRSGQVRCFSSVQCGSTSSRYGEELLQAMGQLFAAWRCRLALPDHQYLPSKMLKACPLESIAADIARDLGRPVFKSRLRNPLAFLATVLVPEAPVNEHDLPESGKYKVWLAGESPDMQSIPKPHAVYKPADEELRVRVARPDLRHVGAALGLSKPVGHRLAVRARFGFTAALSSARAAVGEHKRNTRIASATARAITHGTPLQTSLNLAPSATSAGRM